MWDDILNTTMNAFQPTVSWLPVTFQNSDLVSGELTIRHYRNTKLIVPVALFNADGVLQDQAGIFQIVDEFTAKYTFAGNLEAGKYLFIFQFLYL
jgi:hypothetical protein